MWNSGLIAERILGYSVLWGHLDLWPQKSNKFILKSSRIVVWSLKKLYWWYILFRRTKSYFCEVTSTLTFTFWSLDTNIHPEVRVSVCGKFEEVPKSWYCDIMSSKIEQTTGEQQSPALAIKTHADYVILEYAPNSWLLIIVCRNRSWTVHGLKTSVIRSVCRKSQRNRWWSMSQFLHVFQLNDQT